MSARLGLKAFVPPIAVDAAKRLRGQQTGGANALDWFLENGKVPWSCGYDEYKTELILRVLAHDTLMQAFRHGTELPAGYGVGVDERCVEYPVTSQ